MSNILSKPDRSSQVFTDDGEVFFPIFDNNETQAVNQDGRLSLTRVNTPKNRATFVVNKTGTLIAKNKLVRIIGWSAPDDTPAIELASATADKRADGYLMEDIDNNVIGVLINRGIMAGVDTSGAAINDPVYMTDSGGISTTPPATGIRQVIGKVIRVDAALGSVSFDLTAPVEDENLVPAWRASTPYKAGTIILQDGQLWVRNAYGVSGSEFDPTLWTRANQEHGVANIMDFGAIPYDGSTLVDNQPMIQAAVNSGANIIFVPPGRFRTESAVVISASDVSLVGTGPASSIEASQDGQNTIEIHAASAASRLKRNRVENIRIRGVRAWNASIVANTAGSSFLNVGIYPKWTDELSLTNVEVDSCVGYGIAFYEDTRTRVENNYFHDQYFDPDLPDPGSGNADIYSSSQASMHDALVVGNLFCSNAKNHIFSAAVARGAVITGNIFWVMDANGETLAENEINLSHNFNFIYGKQEGQTGETNRYVISNNLCGKTRVCAIYGSANKETVASDVGPEVIISNNICYRNGINTTATDVAINGAIMIFPCRNAMVDNNLVLDYQGIGRAIHVQSNRDDSTVGNMLVAVTNNVVRGSSNHGIYANGPMDSLFVVNNKVYDTNDDGITIQMQPGTPGTESRMVVDGNTIERTGNYGVFINPLDDQIRIEFNRNYINDTANRGAYIANQCRYVTVDDNHIRNPADSANNYCLNVFTTAVASGEGYLRMRRNRFEQPNSETTVVVQYGSPMPANPDFWFDISDNEFVNNNAGIVGVGLYLIVENPYGRVDRNLFKGSNVGLQFHTLTGRVKGLSVDGNNFQDLTHGVYCAASSTDGLVPLTNTHFVNVTNRLHPTRPSFIECSNIGNDLLLGTLDVSNLALFTDGPGYGTWLEGDWVFSTTPSADGPRAIVCVQGGTSSTSEWEAFGEGVAPAADLFSSPHTGQTIPTTGYADITGYDSTDARGGMTSSTTTGEITIPADQGGLFKAEFTMRFWHSSNNASLETLLASDGVDLPDTIETAEIRTASNSSVFSKHYIFDKVEGAAQVIKARIGEASSGAGWTIQSITMNVYKVG